MRVHVINTGTELLLGDVLNTHLAFIAREVFPLGLRIAQQVTVPDGDAIRTALSEAFRDADIVFVTGGLGPTTDDITREISAELLGLPLRQDAAVAEAITTRLRTRGFPMVERILRQADVPEGAVVLPNENGTAPGLYIAANTSQSGASPHLFLLPGPPRELHAMFRDSVLPIVRAITPARSVESRTFRFACIGESVVEAAIGAAILALPHVELGYCARAGEVDVRVVGAPAAVEKAEAIIRRAFPTGVFAVGAERLEDVVVRLLADREETLALAESCTGGYLAHRITNVPGASAVFLAGYVTYANEAKADTLGIDAAVIAKDGAVSKQVAMRMAEGARNRSGATYALSTTGIAGPSGGSDEKPVGTVFIGLASAHAPTSVERFRFLTDRETFKQMVAQSALEKLRLALNTAAAP